MIKPVVQILEDDDCCPFGKKYKGTPMKDVPVGYFHWIWNNVKQGDLNLQAVRDYIFRNIHVLKEEDDDLIWDNE